MKKLLIINFMFFLTSVLGQINFDDKYDVYNRDLLGEYVIYDDFDQDGDIDIIKYGEYSPYNVILQLNENGDFNAKAPKLVSNNAEVITSLDINNDSYPDLITFNTNDSLGILDNMQDNSFGQEEALVDLSLVYSMKNPLKVDYNQDGYTDLILTDNNENVYLFLNNQTGGFENPQNLFTLNSFDDYIYKIVDFDNDGDYDFYVIGYPQSLKIYLNNNGSFTAPSVLTTNSSLESYGVIDIDGNGYQDVLYWANDGFWAKYYGLDTNNQLTVLNNIPVVNNIPYFTNTNEGSALHIETDSATGNHAVYIALVTYAGEKNIYRFDIQNGVFGNAQIVLPGYQIHNSSFFQYKFLDLDNDGSLDVSYTGNQSMILINYDINGANDKTICIQQSIAPYKLTVIDMDGDGVKDIGVGRQNGLGYFEKNNNVDPGDMRYLIGVLSKPNASPYVHNHILDIDNDGLGDIIDFNLNTGDIKIYRNLGNDNFDFIQATSLNSPSYYLYFADIDSDGYKDLLFVPPYNSNQPRWLKNDNGNSFVNLQDLTITSTNPLNIKTFELGDFNNDNQTDLLVLNERQVNNQYYEDIILFENQNGQFTETMLFTLDDYYSRGKLKIVDFDQDGDLDFFVYSGLENFPFLFYKNDGQNNFDKITIVINNIEDMEVDDVDADGFNEIYAFHYDPASYYNKVFYYTTTDYNNFSRFDIGSYYNYFSDPNTSDKGDLLLFDYNGNNYKEIFISNPSYSDYSISMYKNLTGGLKISKFDNNRQALKVFPNPFVSSVIIDGKAEKYNVKLFDLNGKLLKEFTTKNHQVNLSGIDVGIYLLTVEDKSANKSWSYKIIKKTNQ